ncbi:MAG: glycosyltransferase family 9 protein [Woeseiaceae bacterium]|nr:glycosyltransferase family 9 protein [Woeseiaceae bacterium]
MKNPEAIRSICIIRLSAIGDVCNTLAVVRAIQSHSPNTKITWIIGKVESSLVEDIDDIEFIVFDKSNNLSSYKKIYRQLSSRKFDVALLMHASLRANIISLMIKSSSRIGYDSQRARDLQWLISNKKIHTAGKHVLDTMLDFIQPLGMTTHTKRWDIPLSEESLSFAEIYSRNKVPTVIISPCSSDRYLNYRNWSVENFQIIIKFLIEKYDCKVILTGGGSKNEKLYGKRLTENSNIINLIGKTSLKQLCAIIDKADLVICPDSGPAHIATAFNTCVIGLYASSNPARTGPYNSLKLTVNCYPEAVRKYLSKPIKWGERVRSPKVMELIKVEMVKDKINQFFKNFRKNSIS